MKKIILISLIFLGIGNYGFAVNDFNKLSEKDRQQCEKMEYIASYTTFKKLNKEGYWDDEYTKEQMEEFYQRHVRRLSKYDIKIKDIDASIGKNKNYEHVTNYTAININIFNSNNIDFLTPNTMYLVKKKSKNNEAVGVARIIFDSHASKRNGLETYNIGYLISIFDYEKYYRLSDFNKQSFKDTYWKIIRKNKPKDFSFVTLVKKKPSINIPYIKIRNCFVEEYHIKQEN